MSVAGASWWWMRRRIRTRPDLDTTGAEWLRGGGKCHLQAGPLGDLLLAELVGGIPQRQSRMMRPVHIRAVKRADVAAPAQDAAERAVCEQRGLKPGSRIECGRGGVLARPVGASCGGRPFPPHPKARARPGSWLRAGADHPDGQ